MIDYIETIAKEAGGILVDHFGALESSDVSYKSEKDVVTVADRASQDHLIRRIREKFPDDAIVAEEEGGDLSGGDATWFIDPLDGTTNFVHRFPFFSVSIARQLRNELQWGVVHNPCSGETFSAVAGEGAFRNGKPIRVTEADDPIRSLIATGFACVRSNRIPNTVPIFDRVIREVQGIRRTGSAALDLAYTANGSFDGFYEFNLNRWDLAAGLLLVREAGGVCTDFSGGKRIFERKEVVAGGAAIQNYLITRIGRIAEELGWSLE